MRKSVMNNRHHSRENEAKRREMSDKSRSRLPSRESDQSNEKYKSGEVLLLHNGAYSDRKIFLTFLYILLSQFINKRNTYIYILLAGLPILRTD